MVAMGTFVVLLLFVNILPYVSTRASMDELIANAATSNQFRFSSPGSDEITVEMDIKMKMSDWLEERMESGQYTLEKRKALRDGRKRWTGKTVPYKIGSGFNKNQRGQINAAISDYHRYTCLKFRYAKNSDKNRIKIQGGNGCTSFVGMQGGEQAVTLANNCRIKRIIIHEFGHAIGLHHEHTRPDRDSFVNIIFKNIPQDKHFAFQKYSWGTINAYKVPYDYRSVMHYGRKFFSKNNGDTVVPKNKKYLNIIGTAGGFSYKDIKIINLMYGCGGKCGGKRCSGESYLAKDCKCYCPGNPIRQCNNRGRRDLAVKIDEGYGNGDDDDVGYGDGSSDEGDNGDEGYGDEGGIKGDGNEVNGDESDVKDNEGYGDDGNGVDGGDGDGGNNGESSCIDMNNNCSIWASKGECESNPEYMLSYCKKSCNQCESSSSTDDGST